MSAGEAVHVSRGIVYAARPGFRPLELDLYVPTGRVSALCVYLHGGGWLRGSRQDGPGPLSPSSSQLLKRAAAAGLAVASVDYRLSGEARWPAQSDDVLAACSYVDEHREDYGIGAVPLTVWGVSAGGHLAALRALDADEPKITAAACWYPPTDLAAMPADIVAAGGTVEAGTPSREAMLLGADPRDDLERAAQASPVSRVRRGAPPFLLIHGAADRLVPAEQSRRLAAALADVGADVQLELVEGRDHMLPGIAAADLEALVDRTVSFLLHQAGVG